MSHDGGACCAQCAADPILSVVGCAPCAAATVAGYEIVPPGDVVDSIPRVSFRNTETDYSAHGLPSALPDLDVAGLEGAIELGAYGPEFVGDTGDDVLRVVAQVDKTIGDTVANVFRGGSLDFVAQLHDARMAAQQQAAPQYYDQPAAPPPPPPAPAPGAGKFIQMNPAVRRAMLGRVMQSAPVQAAMARKFLTPKAIQDATIARLKTLIPQATAGDVGARNYFKALRDRAASGELQARREWAAALELAPRVRR